VVAYLLNMPSGFRGRLSRAEHAKVEAQQIDAALPPLEYGTLVIMDPPTGKIRRPVAADLTTAPFYGLLVAPYPTQGGPGVAPNYLTQPIGSVAPAGLVGDVLRSGYMYVHLGGATPAVKHGAVHVWTDVSGGTQVTGNVTAVAAVAGSVIVVPGAYFMSAADANGIVEVQFNI